MNFSNLIGKKIRSCFVPADKASITFVMEDGFRRSLGVQNAGGTRIPIDGHTIPESTEFATVTAVTDNSAGGSVSFVTDNGIIELGFATGASLVELPE